ncbi:hypothetical protein PIB30_106627, partial [Stylosanthes scabra]|nr:hypothetical protein [Stylosanthes scabra]
GAQQRAPLFSLNAARNPNLRSQNLQPPPFVLAGLVLTLSSPFSVVVILVFAVADIASNHHRSLFLSILSLPVQPLSLPPSILLPGRRVRSGWLLQRGILLPSLSKLNGCCM